MHAFTIAPVAAFAVLTSGQRIPKMTWHFPNTTMSSSTMSVQETYYAPNAPASDGSAYDTTRHQATSNSIMSYLTTSVFETCGTPNETASDESAYGTTRYHVKSNTHAGYVLAQTKVQEPTVTPDVYASYITSIPEPHNKTHTRVGNTMRYMYEVHCALAGLASMLLPNYTTNSDITNVNVATDSLSNDSSTTFNSHIPTTTPPVPTQVSAGPPLQMTPQFDLIFLNATSPSYIVLDHANNSFIMIWQAPIDESSTPANPLDDAKKATTPAQVFYIVVQVLVGSVALVRIVQMIVGWVR